jgi:hypothetical protein
MKAPVGVLSASGLRDEVKAKAGKNIQQRIRAA